MLYDAAVDAKRDLNYKFFGPLRAQSDLDRIQKVRLSQCSHFLTCVRLDILVLWGKINIVRIL